MSRFARIKLNSIYLTADGLETGTPARARVEGGEQFASNFAATNAVAADGTVHTQTIELGKRGKEFVVVLEYLTEFVMINLLHELNKAVEQGAAVSIVVTDFVGFEASAVPVFENGKIFQFESRSGGILKNVRMKFIAT